RQRGGATAPGGARRRRRECPSWIRLRRQPPWHAQRDDRARLPSREPDSRDVDRCRWRPRAQAGVLAARRPDVHQPHRQLIVDHTVDSLRNVFMQEAEESLAAMEPALLALESPPGAAEPLNE